MHISILASYLPYNSTGIRSFNTAFYSHGHARFSMVPGADLVIDPNWLTSMHTGKLAIDRRSICFVAEFVAHVSEKYVYRIK